MCGVYCCELSIKCTVQMCDMSVVLSAYILLMSTLNAIYIFYLSNTGCCLFCFFICKYLVFVLFVTFATFCCNLFLRTLSCIQISWKKLAGHQSNQLLEVVTKIDKQVQSMTVPMNMAQKSIKMVEVAKMRRKKYYRLESEEKPVFPFQQKNFYNHIMENKEIVKTLALLSMCTQNVKSVTIVSNIIPYI